MNDTLTQEDKIKAIPGKEMAAAIKSMNEYLTAKSQPLVVFEKTTKEEALTNLLTPIIAAIEAGEAENLPEDVIAFYNNHLVDADPEEEVPVEKPAKAGKPAKAKKEKVKKEPKPKSLSNEEATYNMVVAGKSDDEIHEHFKGVYAGKGKDEAFIAKRAGIYTTIAKRKYASENAEFQAKWDAEKAASKPVKEKAAPKEKVVKEKAAPKAKVAPKKAAPATKGK